MQTAKPERFLRSGFFCFIPSKNNGKKTIEKTAQICYAICMENGRLKALLKLLTSETATYGAVLRREIAAALKEDPAGVQTALAEEFVGTAPLPVLHTLEEIYWEELTRLFAAFSAKINPDLE